jgi:hypothetical protein
MDSNLDAGYAAMAADGEREAEALTWSNALARDMIEEARLGGRIDSLSRSDMQAIEDAILVHLGIPR